MRLRVRLSTLIAAALAGLGSPAVAGALPADGSAPRADASEAAATTDAAAPTASGADAAAQSSDNGPVEGPSSVQTSSHQPTGGPDQETGTSADASIDNDASVGQASGQAQDRGPGGNGASAGSPAGQANPAAQRDQEAHTNQQADAEADASAQNPQNDSKGVRNGRADAGDGGPVGQSNASNAAAQAAAAQSTSQEAGPVSGSSAATGEQSASADADAKADKGKNSIVNARVEAPGNDAGFEQSNRAEARAEAETKRAEKAAERADERRGEDVAQEARAAANAELDNPTNTAVEVRLYSDGDTTGGAQSNAALAEAVVTTDGANADASASAEVSDPANTYVSLRVNSAGTTDSVEQETLEQEIETVNGASETRVERDADDRTWGTSDPTSGLVVELTADGANTDLRIALDDPSLPRPSEGTIFIWTWDLVFGPGGELACAIASSNAGGVVTWDFDCDPADEIERAADASTPTPTDGAISWTWSWDRPELPSWAWNYTDVISIPTCSAGCAYVFDFHWLSYEPVELAVIVPSAAEAPAEVEPMPAVEQANEASATAVATAASDAVQIVSQTTEGAEAPLQIVLQQLNVLQVATARAAAELSDASNISLQTGGTALQAHRAAAEVEARLASTIVQQIAQHGGGEDSVQTQAALQSTLTTQVLGSVAVATLVGGHNTGLSAGGTSSQATNSSAAATGAETAAVRQTIEQEQAGSDADQEQVAGQWSEVVQELELVAAAGLRDATNESRLRDETSSLRAATEAESTGSSRSAITQLAIQLQNGDETSLQQESLQEAIVEQIGVGLAAATADTIRLVYATAPPGAAPDAAAEPAAEVALTAAEPLSIGAAAVPTVAVVELGSTRRIAPRAAPVVRTARTAAPSTSATTSSAPPQAAASSVLIKLPASPTGLTAGSASSKAGEDAEKAAARSSGGPCVAPLAGAAAVTAGNGSGSAFVALPGIVLTPLPRLGRRVLEPAGRRPAAVVALRARPG